ncbi:hypothetical protein UJ101_00226 [Flavobacteriaceae bacterium UJ101]|nr:hypothetical protein UJ101_00226 [Flavobacteriaceae bacterium UJ101]
MKKIQITIIYSFLCSIVFAQVGIGTSTVTSDAVLEVKSNSKGALIMPRLTEVQRDAISSPVDGLAIFNTDIGCVETYNDETAEWYNYCCGSTVSANFPATLAKFLYVDASDRTSVIDWNGNTPLDSGFEVGNLRFVNDLSGNGRNLRTTRQNLIEYDDVLRTSYRTSNSVSSNASFSDSGLEYTFQAGESFDNKDFDLFMIAGFTTSTDILNGMFFASAGSNGIGAWQIGQGGTGAITCANTGNSVSKGLYILRHQETTEASSRRDFCGPAIDDQLHLFRLSYKDDDGNASTRGGQFFFYIDGGLIASPSVTGGSAFDRLRFFLNVADTKSAPARFHEVFFYDRILSADDVAKQDEYFSCKWGLVTE